MGIIRESEMQTAHAFHGYPKPKTQILQQCTSVSFVQCMHQLLPTSTTVAMVHVHPIRGRTLPTDTSMYSIIAYQVGHRPQKMKAWIKLCAFLVCSGSPHMTTMEFVSPGFGSWTVIEAPDICRVHITESFRTVNTPLPKDLQYQKLGQGHLLICLRLEPNV